ncbi:lipocalin family protein [Zoogloea sp.]|uniref:lipocalin family protein n=1 Tax=Zoogloea sp. TaxID=49181 RepID=UPI0035AE8FFC
MMKKNLLALLCCLGAMSAATENAVAADGAPPAPAALNAIPSLDVPRYMGTWYEIARFPNWFQRKCTGDSKAEYSLRQDGMVQVINRCRTEGGAMMEAVGTARQIGPTTSAKLEVRFAPAWLSFLPFVWGDYWVIDLDEGYQLVAVSEPRREYLWILARTPQVAREDYARLLARLEQKGFDLGRLERTGPD